MLGFEQLDERHGTCECLVGVGWCGVRCKGTEAESDPLETDGAEEVASGGGNPCTANERHDEQGLLFALKVVDNLVRELGRETGRAHSGHGVEVGVSGGFHVLRWLGVAIRIDWEGEMMVVRGEEGKRPALALQQKHEVFMFISEPKIKVGSRLLVDV